MWRSNSKIENKCIERNYSATSDSIHAIVGSLDRSRFPLPNEYKFIRLAYIHVKLFTIL